MNNKMLDEVETMAIKNGSGGILINPGIFESEKHNGEKQKERTWGLNRIRDFLVNYATDLEVVNVSTPPPPKQNDNSIVLNRSKITFYLFVPHSVCCAHKL